MKSVLTQAKWFQFHRRFTNWRKKRSEDRLAVLTRAEERSIGILQKRYGFTREQAISELHKHYANAWLG